jgi:N-acetylmuramoyl-L-alanine amidase
VSPGAIYKNIHEETINLELSMKLANTLQKEGATVLLTRYGDYDLSANYAQNRKRSDLYQRTRLINNSNCDLYLSIHLNADTSSVWSGAQVFYDDINDENVKIAKIMQDELKRYLGARRKISELSNMYIYRRVERPGILIEVGFLTNPNDRYILRQNYYQEKVANTITIAVKKYFATS